MKIKTVKKVNLIILAIYKQELSKVNKEVLKKRSTMRLWDICFTKLLKKKNLISWLHFTRQMIENTDFSISVSYKPIQ